jgi:hypothetical protein
MTEWLTVAGLGAWHGINPGMGWLFAAALGLQQGNARAVWRALPPLAAGHALAVIAALGVALALGLVVDPTRVAAVAGLVLIGAGLYRLRSGWHPRYGGMQVTARDLTIWSFLMASAHGAGLMVVPFALGAVGPVGQGTHAAHAAVVGPANAALVAAALHTAAYLAVTAAVGAIVYRKASLGFLRRWWINVDVVWGIALVVTGVAALAHVR